MFTGGANDGMHTEEPFAHAPYIHPWNAPKYHAQQLVMTNKKFTDWAMQNNYMFSADKK